MKVWQQIRRESIKSDRLGHEFVAGVVLRVTGESRPVDVDRIAEMIGLDVQRRDDGQAGYRLSGGEAGVSVCIRLPWRQRRTLLASAVGCVLAGPEGSYFLDQSTPTGRAIAMPRDEVSRLARTWCVYPERHAEVFEVPRRDALRRLKELRFHP